MAYFLVRNSMNPSKAVKFGITYRQLVDINDQNGELIWVIEVATDEPTVSGEDIPPYFINLTSLDDLDEEIEKAIGIISEQIDWEPLLDDTRAPFVDSVYPDTYIAKIHSSVIATIKDLHPATGIDANSIQVFVNDVNVTSDLIIRGDEFEYEVEWRPFSRVYTQLTE